MKTVYLYLSLIGCLFLSIVSKSQFVPLVTVYDSLLPNIENSVYSYNFGYPVLSDILNNKPSTPSSSKRYQISLFGPRYKTTSGTNQTTYDFHQGEDFSGDFTYNGITYTTDTTKINLDSSNLAKLVCACKGIVDDVIDGTDAAMELIETGRSVRVKCNDLFDIKNKTTDWGNIYIVYRHLSKVIAFKGDSINIGDTIGVMGNSGYTSTVHLHFSVQRKSNTKFVNVHPMRIFNPNAITYLHTSLKTAYIEHIHSWTDSAVLRLSIPRTQMCIKQIKVKYKNVIDKTFDFETVSDDANRDDYNIVSGISVLAYNFNRASSQYKRYQSTASNMLPFYPASPLRDTALGRFPIEDKPPYNDAQIVATFDLMVRNLPAGYSYKDIEVHISDIYGNTVKTVNTSTSINAEYLMDKNYNFYPIPSSENLIIEGIDKDMKLSVINTLGQIVLVENLETGNNTINISSLPKGIYYCRLEGVNGVQKIIVN